MISFSHSAEIQSLRLADNVMLQPYKSNYDMIL